MSSLSCRDEVLDGSLSLQKSTPPEYQTHDHRQPSNMLSTSYAMSQIRLFSCSLSAGNVEYEASVEIVVLAPLLNPYFVHTS